MNTKKYFNLTRLKTVFGISLFALMMWLFWGPLFVFSPIKIGYDTIKLSKVDIFVEDKLNIDPTLLRIEEIMREEEEFHGLNYRKKINIVIMNDNSEFKRFIPWLGQKAGAVNISSINTIYFGTNLQIDSETMEVYLKHELSHALIVHYCSFINALEIFNQGWFVEGIATLIGDPVFFTRRELAEECRKRNISFDSVLSGNPHSFTRKEIYFRYTYFRYFVEYFREKYGKEKFYEFMMNYFEKPKEYPRIYQDIFGININEDIKNYGKELLGK